MAKGGRRYLCITDLFESLPGLNRDQVETKPNVVDCVLQSLSAYEEGMRELSLAKSAVLAEMDERSKVLFTGLSIEIGRVIDARRSL
jgi:hypothetical protein